MSFEAKLAQRRAAMEEERRVHKDSERSLQRLKDDREKLEKDAVKKTEQRVDLVSLRKVEQLRDDPRLAFLCKEFDRVGLLEALQALWDISTEYSTRTVKKTGFFRDRYVDEKIPFQPPSMDINFPQPEDQDRYHPSNVNWASSSFSLDKYPFFFHYPLSVNVNYYRNRESGEEELILLRDISEGYSIYLGDADNSVKRFIDEDDSLIVKDIEGLIASEFRLRIKTKHPSSRLGRPDLSIFRYDLFDSDIYWSGSINFSFLGVDFYFNIKEQEDMTYQVTCGVSKDGEVTKYIPGGDEYYEQEEKWRESFESLDQLVDGIARIIINKSHLTSSYNPFSDWRSSIVIN